ncbi:unnamed protein product [Candidula unifasciata]|uniref:Cytochrome P450 n=1 Tax=Candidula unifasciata TaxID=100452 RepID=A0A8S3YIB6_9EUPU|nr:unnamed protein product [Candidula unifasciata]
MLDILLAFLVVLLVAKWWLSGQRKGLPPGPPFALPFVGHLYLLPKDPMSLLEKWRKKYGNVYMLKFGSQPALFIHEHGFLCEALVKNHETFMNRNETFVTKTLLGCKGIFSLSGDAWKEQRAFVHATLRDLGMGKNVMAERIQEEVKHFLRSIEETKGQPTNFSNLITATVCNIICGVVFGKRFSHKDELFLELLSNLQFLFRELGTSMPIQFFPFLKYLPGDYFLYHESVHRCQRMKSVIWDMINKNGRKVNTNDESFEDLVQAYLTEIEKKKVAGITNTSIDEENLLHTVWNFFNAGTETTSKTVIFCLLYLVYFQDIQEKLFQEIHENIGTERSPQMSDKPKLKLLNAFLLETFRHSKMGPFAPDRVASKDVVLKGFLIPKGTVIIPVFDSITQNKEVWGDPENFRPERFLDEAKKDFTVFSVGKRNCVGEAMAVMELFLILSSMIQRYQFLPERHGQKPSLETEFGFTRSPEPFKVRAVLRSNKKSTD